MHVVSKIHNILDYCCRIDLHATRWPVFGKTSAKDSRVRNFHQCSLVSLTPRVTRSGPGRGRIRKGQGRWSQPLEQRNFIPKSDFEGRRHTTAAVASIRQTLRQGHKKRVVGKKLHFNLEIMHIIEMCSRVIFVKALHTRSISQKKLKLSAQKCKIWPLLPCLPQPPQAFPARHGTDKAGRGALETPLEHSPPPKRFDREIRGSRIPHWGRDEKNAWPKHRPLKNTNHYIYMQGLACRHPCSGQGRVALRLVRFSTITTQHIVYACRM